MLTDVKVAKLKYEGQRTEKLRIEKHPDRDGLFLAVSPPHKDNPKATYGSKAWRYEYRWPPTTQGKRQTLTYGKYPEISLSEAREKHLEARKAIANGINPAEQKQDNRRALLIAAGNTYEIVSLAWFNAASKGKSTSWLEAQERWQKIVHKAIGSRPLTGITDDHVMAAVKPFLDEGHAFSADRARQQIANVFRFARRKPWKYDGVNPARELAGEIQVPQHKNHRHIDAEDIPAFLKAVDDSKGAEQTKIAARLLLLTFVRKQELLAAKRSELNLSAGIWEVPAERVKNRLPHLVPLSRQAVELFKRQLEIAGKSEYVFPNTQRPGEHAGLSTLNVFFDRIGFNDRLTPHGLRSVASTKLNGTRKFGGEIIELQLSHKRKGVKAVYDKSKHLEVRAEMMQFWADYVDHLCDGKPEENKVIQIHAAAA